MVELTVDKKNLKDLFDMNGKKFIIPDYQRPYAWDKEQCETLWDDFKNNLVEGKEEEEYFLGTIVICKNNKDIEIIDGQQRITSLFLLLRAFYSKLDTETDDKDIQGLKDIIGKCLWDINEITGKINMKKIHISSDVALDDEKEDFYHILETGKSLANNNKPTQYKKNYDFFCEQNNDFAEKHPMKWDKFVLSILKQVIILPIECDDINSALTIFSTLNNRGIPLSDSDIFKAKIYSDTESEDKDVFIEKWKTLSESTKDAGTDIDFIFRCYTHIIRAENGNTSSEIGLRKFYIDNKSNANLNKVSIDFAIDLAKFWQAIHEKTPSIAEETKELFSIKAQKYIHCLQHYPNDYWKYAVAVFYHKHSKDKDFLDKFAQFIEKLTAFLFMKFIKHPTVNEIKPFIFKMCADIYKGNKINFIADELYKNEDLLNMANSRITRSLLLLYAYLNEKQDKLLLAKLEIEHIFPRQWKKADVGWNEEDANECLDSFGNKVMLEKAINARCGNAKFQYKQDCYKESHIAEVKNLYEKDVKSWQPDDVKTREKEFVKRISTFFQDNLTNAS